MYYNIKEYKFFTEECAVMAEKKQMSREGYEKLEKEFINGNAEGPFTGN